MNFPTSGKLPDGNRSGGEMEYWIAQALKKDALIELVNDAITKGWRPQGGIAVACGEAGSIFSYSQAMVRG